MTLTGKQAEEYIRRFGNPQQESAPIQPQQSGISKFFQGLINPVKQYISGVGSDTMGLLGQLPGQFGQQAKSNQSEFNQQMFGQRQVNPLENTLKGAAGIGAYAVPGMSGVSPLVGGAIQGAGAGLLSGISNQGQGQLDIGNVLSTAGLGGGIGAIAGGIGGVLSKKMAGKVAPTGEVTPMKTLTQFNQEYTKGLSKVKKSGLVGEYVNDFGFRAPTYKNTKSLNITGSLDKQVFDVDGALQYYGLPRSTEGISALPDKLGVTKSELLAAIPKTWRPTGNAIITTVPEAVGKTGIKKDLLTSSVNSRINEILGNAPLEYSGATPQGTRYNTLNIGPSYKNQASLGAKLDAEALDYLKQQTLQGANSVHAAKGGLAARNITDQTAADYAIHQWASKELNNVSNKELKTVSDTFYTLISQNPNLAKAYTNDMAIEVSQGLTPTSMVARSFVKGGAQALNKAKVGIGSLFSKNVSKVGTPAATTAQKITTPGIFANNPSLVKDISGGITNALGANAGKIGDFLNQQQSQPQELNGMVTDSQLPDMLGNIVGLPEYQQALGELTTQILAVSPSLSPQSAQAYATSVLSSKGITPPSTKNAQKVQDIKSSVSMLQNLSKMVDSYGSQMGPISGRISGIKSALGSNDASALTSTIGIAQQNLGKALEGGKMSDKDIARYQKILGDMNQTPEQMKEIINALYGVLGSEYASLQ
jgi:hypothetical protein